MTGYRKPLPLTRHTKIVATIGPASSSRTIVDALIRAGVDVVRLNFSHGTHESHASAYAAVREAAAHAGRHVAILQDLSGPKIRTGALENGHTIELREGDALKVAVGDGPGDSRRIFTAYRPLVVSARPGDRLLLDDGKIELQVTGAENGELMTTVLNGGELGEHKGINAPGVDLPSGALTDKDARDLQFGIELGVDFVALSFVQTPEDIAAARAILSQARADIPIVAKIERPQALDRLDEIVTSADAVMVARGDLGLECPLAEIPRVQKAIIARARAHGRPVILATQVFESMRTEPRPTRAEVSDAATAVDQGADAIMLAGETAVGAYPVRAVETLAAVIADAETVAPSISGTPGGRQRTAAIDVAQSLLGSRHGVAMCEAAVTLASSGQADAIVALTREGRTAQLLSTFRPRAAVLAMTEREVIARRLALCWGVLPIVAHGSSLSAFEATLRESCGLPAGATVIFISLSPDLTREDANFMNVQRIRS
jgi:pyruvate kinase